jgi:hypothetical protein
VFPVQAVPYAQWRDAVIAAGADNALYLLRAAFSRYLQEPPSLPELDSQDRWRALHSRGVHGAAINRSYVCPILEEKIRGGFLPSPTKVRNS